MPTHAGTGCREADRKDVSDGRVTRIWAVRNPEKLRPWARGG